MHRTVNLKVLGITVVAVALLVGGVHLLHGRQVKRHAGAMLRQADDEAEHGHFEDARAFMGDYLQLAPNDLAAHEKYAQMLKRMGTAKNNKAYLREAYNHFERVVQADRERRDLEEQLLELALTLGSYDRAMIHVQALDPKGENPQLMYTRGLCEAQRGRYADALKIFNQILKNRPQDIPVYIAAADLLRNRMGQHPEADQMIARMVDKNPKDYKAYLASARYWQSRGDLRKAGASLTRATELARDKPEVLLASAQLDLEQPRPDLKAIEQKLLRSLHLDGNNPGTYLALARLRARQGDTSRAIDCLEQALAKFPGPDHLEIAWTLLNLLLDDRQLDKARHLKTQLVRVGAIHGADLQFLDAREQMVRGEWVDACASLENLRASLARTPDRLRQVDFLLGLCYEKLGDAQQQYDAFHRVIAADSSDLLDQLSTRSYRGMGAALLALNRLDDAIESYRQATLRDPSTRVELARLLVLKNLRLPPARRNYAEAEGLLAGDAAGPAQAAAVALLRAQIRSESNDLAGARKILEDLRQQNPENLDTWIALANLADRSGKVADAFRLLDQAEKKFGDRVPLRLARAGCLVRQGKKENVPALARLLQGADAFNASDRASLLRGLIAAYEQLGDQAEADRLLEKLTDVTPRDPEAWMARFLRAAAAKDSALMKQAVDELHALEGDKGVEWKYAEILRLLSRAEQGDRSGLDQARSLIASFPGQPARIVACAGRVEDLAGREEIAIDRYRQAVETGERNPSVTRRLMQLLAARNRYAEISRIMEKLPEQLALSSEIKRLNAEVALHTTESSGDLKGALARVADLARRAVAADSKDYQDQLWLGYMLLAAGQLEEARAAMERAVHLRPDSTETWVGLVAYLNKTGPDEKDRRTQEVLERARKALPAGDQALAFAQFYEQIGRTSDAQKEYDAAIAQKPRDIPTLRAVANFYVYTVRDRNRARRYLEDIIALTKVEAEKNWAERLLAFSLMSAGNRQQARQACKVLGLLDENVITDWLRKGDLDALEDLLKDRSADDLRTMAAVAAGQPERDKRRYAIALLELLARRRAQRPADLFLLAQLYQSTGNPRKCRQTMLQLLASESDNPQYMAYYASLLLADHDLTEAEAMVARIERLPRQEQAFATVELKARLRAARGQHQDAQMLVTAYLDSPKAEPPDRTRRLLLAGMLEDSLSQAHRDQKAYAASAEQFYRDYVRQRPDDFLQLVGLLGRQGQIKKALDAAAAGWEKGKTREATAEACLGAMHGGILTAEDLERVDGLLRTAREKMPDSNRLRVALADLRDLQQRYDESIGLYQQVIQAEPKNVVALNNLAWLLALDKGRGDEAMQLINRAMDEWGPVADLRDTRAVIYLSQGQGEAAIGELQEAIADGKTGPRYFHLAEAYLQQRRPAEARAAWLEAGRLGLRAEQLHALERPAYNEMRTNPNLSKQ